jgi:hypothetical protein
MGFEQWGIKVSLKKICFGEMDGRGVDYHFPTPKFKQK